MRGVGTEDSGEGTGMKDEGCPGLRAQGLEFRFRTYGLGLGAWA